MYTLSTGTGSLVLSALGWGFFGSFLFITIWFLTHQEKEHNAAYQAVYRQRFWITVVGFLIGAIPAAWLSMTCGFRIGHFLFYLFFIVHGVYMAWPKKSMLDSNPTPEQTKAWIQKYRTIHLVSLMGFATGLVVSIVVMVNVMSPEKKTSVCKILS